MSVSKHKRSMLSHSGVHSRTLGGSRFVGIGLPFFFSLQLLVWSLGFQGLTASAWDDSEESRRCIRGLQQIRDPLLVVLVVLAT